MSRWNNRHWWSGDEGSMMLYNSDELDR
jgi:hypothetical protein